MSERPLICGCPHHHRDRATALRSASARAVKARGRRARYIPILCGGGWTTVSITPAAFFRAKNPRRSYRGGGTKAA